MYSFIEQTFVDAMPMGWVQGVAPGLLRRLLSGVLSVWEGRSLRGGAESTQVYDAESVNGTLTEVEVGGEEIQSWQFC